MAIKLYLSQINTTVGDLDGNCAKILAELEKAERQGCDLVIFHEMAICGYPCEDLWQKKYFILEVEEKIREICAATKGLGCAVLVGCPTVGMVRKKEVFFNSALLIEKGEVKKIVNKKTLPNYGVFDEKRYFANGDFLATYEFRGQTLALLICEDLWDAKNLFLLQEQVFDNLIVINSSPYAARKLGLRMDIAKNFATSLRKPVIYVNQVGGQDSLVFDGASFVLDNKGAIAVLLKSFSEDSALVEIAKDGELLTGNINNVDLLSANYSACLLGLRDYILKNNFTKALLGMSGGIDSALVAAMAVDALGAENIMLYALPSRYNSESSMIDAKACAKNLSVNLEIISIEGPFKAMLSALGEIKNLTQENLQSRIRGNILMAISNDSGALLLSTGNKSEMAMGYATLYGDMCGAFNPLKDLYKTEIYELVNWRNKNIPEISFYKKTDLIPQNIITKAPSAELREGQKDSDSLPEYDILDKILQQLIEEQKSVEDIVKSGVEEGLVKKVARGFYMSEYKRRQVCIGPKVSVMAFDKERRYPIINKFIK